MKTVTGSRQLLLGILYALIYLRLQADTVFGKDFVWEDNSTIYKVLIARCLVNNVESNCLIS
jgi:hypothetical protein